MQLPTLKKFSIGCSSHMITHIHTHIITHTKAHKHAHTCIHIHIHLRKHTKTHTHYRYCYCRFAAQSRGRLQNSAKSIPNGIKIGPKSIQNRSWRGLARLGTVLRRSLGRLGASCGVLGASWGVLGASWWRLGDVLRRPRAVFEGIGFPLQKGAFDPGHAGFHFRPSGLHFRRGKADSPGEG